MTSLHRQAINLIQRASRRLDSRYLELFYQASYFELARNTTWVAELPMASPSGGTASFSQLYVLLSILRDSTPQSVLEIGAGRSTKLITQYAAAAGTRSLHVDQDADWLARSLTENEHSTSLHAPLRPTSVGSRTVQWYDELPTGRFDFVLVDGPEAWDSERAYDRTGFLTWVPEVLDNEFVIVIDDTSRKGERALVEGLERALADRNVPPSRREIVGANSQTILATQRFASALYL